MNQNRFRDLSEELKKELQKALGGTMKELILFGSYARGDQAPDSDLDFMLLLNQKLSRKEEEDVNEISSRISLKYDTVIVCLDYLAEDFEKKATSLIQNVKREGRRI